MQRTLEILAPGKNVESAKEAIKCGADAIYIASEGFGLRKDLDNSIDEIKELVEFAHKYWAKIYVTVNTLIFNDDDFKKAENLIKDLYNIEVDAIIVQDMGILELDLPPIPLIASTNTCCFTPEKVAFMEKIGFSMVVLPRELTIDQIREIADKTNIRLEAFCYGLLCVGYSGRCYLQYARTVQKTQGNKDLLYYQYNCADNGKCDQNCMDFYNLLDADGNYIKEHERLLNLKFNNQADNLLELFDAGVSSFKIEGRHKELSYIKNTTSYFRKKADEIINLRNLQKISSGSCILNFEPDLSKVFNKGYTDYFTHGRKKEMYSVGDMVGALVGTVINYKNCSFELDSDIKLSVGDKLRYKDKCGDIKSTHIEKLNNLRYTCTNVDDDLEGINLYRYFDAEANDIIENAKVYRVISVNLTIEEELKFYKITAIDEDNNKIFINYEKTEDNVSKDVLSNEFSRIDIDEFVFKNINFGEDNLYLRCGNLREQITFELRKKRKNNRPKISGGVIKNNYPYPEKVTYLDNVVNTKAKIFYESHGVTEIENGLETTKHLKGKQILTGKYCIKNELDFCPKNNNQNIYSEPWYLQDSLGYKHEIIFDCQNCEMKIKF